MPLDRVWLWYLATVSVAAALFGWNAPQGAPRAYVALHLGLLLLLLGIRRLLRGRAESTQRAARAGFTLLGIPTVFLALGMVLPAVHPEPWEWTWIALDRALTGTDPTVALQVLLTPWLTEVLQLVYASFYLIPVVTIVVLGARCGGAAFDRALLAVTFGFLLSYLGYFLFPTLPPYRFLPHQPLEGLLLTEWLHAALDAAELHRWDCFPSGHVMLSALCLPLARPVRGLYWALWPVVGLLVLSTLALRYHYLTDVLAGLLLVPFALGCARRLG